MTVHVYAALKDYFGSGFELTAPVQSVAELRALLLEQNPDAAGILPVCRFAVNDTFVDSQFKLQAHDAIHIIPPSSGG